MSVPFEQVVEEAGKSETSESAHALKYFQAQLDLFAQICLDRQYTSITALQHKIPLELLLECAFKEHYSYSLRASFARYAVVCIDMVR